MSIGYACIALGVTGAEFKRCLLKNADTEILRKVTALNLNALEKVIEYNVKNHVKLFRISSDIIPLGSHPSNSSKWWIEYSDRLQEIGMKIRNAGIRVSMHPGQYTVLNSPKEEVVENAIRDLEYHRRFLDSLGVDSANKLILHLGGIYGDKESAVERFRYNYLRLEDGIRSRLVIENDEKCYTVEDVLEVGNKLGIPVVFDNLHHSINPSVTALKDEEWIKACGGTWKKEDGVQKIHYSQQQAGGKPGAHSASIAIAPFMDFYRRVKNEADVDIMLEVKDKNLSAVKCINCASEQLHIKKLEQEWGRYKYLILEHSRSSYLKIREMLKDKKGITPTLFYTEIEKAVSLQKEKGSQINAAQHVWGYFKNIADLKERDKFSKLIDSFINGKSTMDAVKRYLFKLAEKYSQDYLLESYYFIGV